MKDWKTLLKIVVTVGLVVWLVRSVDWSMVGRILAGVSLPLIFGYVLIQLLGNLVSAAKWQYLARIQGFSFNLRDGFFAYLTGAFINNFLPSTVGGDAYRALWMSHAGERTKAAGVVFFDRLTGLLALFFFTGFGLALLPWQLLLKEPAFIIFAAIVFSASFVLLLALFWAERLYALFLRLVRWLLPAKVMAWIQSLEPFAASEVYTRAIGWAVLFTVIGIGGSNYLLFSSLGATVPLLTFLGAIFAATLVANIPISINNIGVKEWSYVFFFGLVGVSTEVAVTAALASRILQMLISFIALPDYLKTKEKKAIR